MSTKQQSSIQYNPQSMGTYSSLQGPLSSVLQQYMKNPLQSSFFNQNVGMGQRQISGQNSTQMRNMLSNARTSGLGAGATSPYMQSMIAMQGRNNAGAQSNNFLQNLNMARQNQMWATGQSAAYSPLMTGQTTQTSGLGTWLPQVLGAAGSAALGFATGGASTAAQGGGGAFNTANGGIQGSGGYGGNGGVNFSGGGGFGSFGQAPVAQPFGFGAGGALAQQNPFAMMAAGGFH